MAFAKNYRGSTFFLSCPAAFWRWAIRRQASLALSSSVAVCKDDFYGQAIDSDLLCSLAGISFQLVFLLAGVFCVLAAMVWLLVVFFAGAVATNFNRYFFFNAALRIGFISRIYFIGDLGGEILLVEKSLFTNRRNFIGGQYHFIYPRLLYRLAPDCRQKTIPDRNVPAIRYI